MAVEHKEEVCEACGCLAEVGTIIHEGDDVVVIPVEGDDEADARARQARYIDVAKQACADVLVSSELQTVADGVVLHTTLQFTCTAEKMIFEMRARSVR
ncbi:YfcZ/YiiS family protein [uncultured Tolumonas sp.]|jgi:uncharacterized protein YfcZ (UPF0381/DUF406 family)|uniref:YfcZ/YiiS family protein n=1 Tax=uncultured Tolumonas sp. TaxID=263765 RepID=UPI00292F5256|nr:YfcZ/YiiS family protein [uncultured Tolumonas sp.]